MGIIPHIEHSKAWKLCMFAALGACVYGYDGVYFTGVQAMDAFIQKFGDIDSEGNHYISPTFLSVTTSMINVGELIGSLGSAYLNDKFGRKGVFIWASIFLCIGIVLQTAANSKSNVMPLFIVGRILLGMGVGSFSVTCPLYMAEIAPTSLRSKLLYCWQFILSISQLIASCITQGTQSIDNSAAYRIPITLQLIFPIALFAGWAFVPESPRWLVSKDRSDEQVSKALLACNSEKKDYDPQVDLSALKAHHEREKEISKDSKWMDLVTDPIERRKVLYSVGALVSQQINGIQFFYAYGTVFSKSIGLDNPFLMTLIVFLVQLVVVGIAILVSNRIPRRPLLIWTTVIMLASLIVVGGVGTRPLDTNSGKVIISFVVLEVAAFNLGWGPLGWTIASEMAVGRNRNKIYSLAVGCFWVTIWVIVFSQPYIYDALPQGPLIGFIYTGLCLITLAYAIFCVGEVKGRSMEDINAFFIEKVPAWKWKDQEANFADRKVLGSEVVSETNNSVKVA